MASISANAQAILEALDAQDLGARLAALIAFTGLPASTMRLALFQLINLDLVDTSQVVGWFHGKGPDPRTWTINDAGRAVLKALQRAMGKVEAEGTHAEPTAPVFVRPVAFRTREAMRSYMRGAA